MATTYGPGVQASVSSSLSTVVSLRQQPVPNQGVQPHIRKLQGFYSHTTTPYLHRSRYQVYEFPMTQAEYIEFENEDKNGLRDFYIKSLTRSLRTGQEVVKFTGMRWFETWPPKKKGDLIDWLTNLHASGFEFDSLPTDFIYYVKKSGFLLLPVKLDLYRRLHSPFRLKEKVEHIDLDKLREKFAVILTEKLLTVLNPAGLGARSDTLLTLAPSSHFIPFDNLIIERLSDCRMIGKGGFGDIYLNKLRIAGTEVEVALKSVKLERAKQVGVEQLLEEHNLMHKLKHPNLLKVFGYTMNKDIIYIVLEYCSNGSLHKHFLNNNTNNKEKVKLLLGVAHGLSFLHSKGFMHLDIKPNNILLDQYLTPKIIDFGLSRKVRHDSIVEKTGLTLLYTSPEQMRGTPLYTKSDVWAFGNLIYFTLAMAGPYEDLQVDVDNVHSFATRKSLLNELETVHRRPVFSSPSTKDVESTLPRLVDLMRSCWAIDADSRPTMVKVANVLESLHASMS